MNQFRIGEQFTLDTWGALLSTFEIGEAQAKTNYIDIPGGDGSIDLTEALTGEVTYENRTITATFTLNQPRSEWSTIMDQIRAYCHGRKFNIKAPYDDDHYFIGRVNVGPLERDGALATFEMTITCDPYKYINDLTVHNFTIGSSGTLTVTLINSRRTAIPTVTINNTTQMIKGSASVSLNAGTHRVNAIPLIQGDNAITFNAIEGTTIQVSYQEAVI